MSTTIGQQSEPQGRAGGKAFMIMWSGIIMFVLAACSASLPSPRVDLQRVPNNGIHPRIVFDEWGDTHLLYFRAEFPDSGAYLGHLYYTHYNNITDSWNPAVRVTSEPFDYKDPIYRANIAVGGEGRVHIVWFVDRPARFYYARSDINKQVFESPDLIETQHLQGIDAAADIASYNNHVALVWSAGDLMREDQRSVFMLESQDFGESFGDAFMIADAGLGACACCSLSAEFNRTGELLVAYRSAINSTGRHMQRLVITRNAHDEVQSFYQPLHALTEWELSSCPVSSNDILRDASGDYWLAYENQSQVVKLNMSDRSQPALISEHVSSTREKHPAMAFNAAGFNLIAWGEGGGFFSGGFLRRALFDRKGNRVGLPALDNIEIPDRSFVAAMVKPDGNFVILY